MKVIAGLEGFTGKQSISAQRSYCGLCDRIYIQKKSQEGESPQNLSGRNEEGYKGFLSFKSYLVYDCFMRQDLIIQPRVASASHTLSDHSCVHPTLKSHSDCIFSSQIK